MSNTPYAHLYKILVVFNDLSTITANDIEDLHEFCQMINNAHEGKIKDIFYKRHDFKYSHLYIGA